MIENVTILVSDIVKFTVVCSTLKPMDVVTTLNSMYSGYDRLTAKHGVCKVMLFTILLFFSSVFSNYVFHIYIFTVIFIHTCIYFLNMN